jgi:hypothetical protein
VYLSLIVRMSGKAVSFPQITRCGNYEETRVVPVTNFL